MVQKEISDFGFKISNCKPPIRNPKLKNFGAALFMIIAAVLLSSCSEKSNILDISKLPKADSTLVVSDTNYIQIQPAWVGFSNPKDIKIGFDDILYVTEPDNNRIVMVNLAGAIVGYSQYVKRPIAIAEDRRFNLIIACEYDTTVGGSVITLAAIAKIRLFDYDHDISAAPVEIVYHENPQQKITRDPVTGVLISGREYTGVGVLPVAAMPGDNNNYYVTRCGNNNTSSTNPDNMVLHFDQNDHEYSDQFINLVPSLVPTGTGFVAINQISNIATFNTKQYSTDFILTQIDPANSFKVKWITFNPGSELFAPSWDSKFSLTSTPLPDILSNIFVSPQAVMVEYGIALTAREARHDLSQQ